MGLTVWVPQVSNPRREELLSFLALPRKYLKTVDPHQIYAVLSIQAQGEPLIADLQLPKAQFGEWIQLPIAYKDLPPKAEIVITLYSTFAPKKAITIARTSFGFYNTKECLRKGRHKVRLWPYEEGQAFEQTPGKIHTKEDEVWRLEKLMERFNHGAMPRVDWMERITGKEITEKIQNQLLKSSTTSHLYIEFPAWEHPVRFHFRESIGTFTRPACMSPTPFHRAVNCTDLKDIISIHDPEMKRENPVQARAKIEQYNRAESTLQDKDLKPDPKQKARLLRVLSYPITHSLTSEEKAFIWKFRYYLSVNPRALTKFTKCVDWSNTKGKHQAKHLLKQWSSVSVEDALELLSSSYKGISPVRRYAISRLETADDSELVLYMLQLVQALRYEKGFYSDAELDGDPGKSVERKDKLPLLAAFLIRRALQNPKLGNYLFWYLTVECPEEGEAKKVKPHGKSYRLTLQRYLDQLQQLTGGTEICDNFENQKQLVAALTDLYSKAQALKKKKEREEIIKELRRWLEPYRVFPWGNLLLPINPDITVTGLIPEKASIFSSATAPFKLTFAAVPYGPDNLEEYTVIFKCGDDPRQDQLVIQMIILMDQLFKKVQLDLRLTPYAVLATSCNDGFVEFIPSRPLRVLPKAKGKNGILDFLRSCQSDEAGYKESLNNFIRSTAGYCMITYILGIGDRHNDNLLIRDSGHMFHIDFGFIVGQEPPLKGFLRAPFKFTKLMKQAMGEDKNYEKFTESCWSAFKELRRHSNLILNLFSLMVDADIPGINLAGGSASILKVQEKFLLELADEQAIFALYELIKASLGNVMLPIIDFLHDTKQS